MGREFNIKVALAENTQVQIPRHWTSERGETFYQEWTGPTWNK